MQIRTAYTDHMEQTIPALRIGAWLARRQSSCDECHREAKRPTSRYCSDRCATEAAEHQTY